MSLSVKEMLDRDLSVKLSQLVGRSLVYVINEQWLEKKKLMNLLSWRIGGMQGTFLPVHKILKIDQHDFELVLGSDNFFAIFQKHSCFEVWIKLLKFFWT